MRVITPAGKHIRPWKKPHKKGRTLGAVLGTPFPMVSSGMAGDHTQQQSTIWRQKETVVRRAISVFGFSLAA